MIRALLIDPEQQDVQYIQVDDNLVALREIFNGELTDTIYLEDGDIAFVEDEGFSRWPQHYWHYETCRYPCAGKAVVLSGKEGPPSATREKLLNRIKFLTFREAFAQATVADIEGRTWAAGDSKRIHVEIAPLLAAANPDGLY